MVTAGVGAQEPAGGPGRGTGGAHEGGPGLRNTWARGPYGPRMAGEQGKQVWAGPPAGRAPLTHAAACRARTEQRGPQPQAHFPVTAWPPPCHWSCPCWLDWAAPSVRTGPCMSVPDSGPTPSCCIKTKEPARPGLSAAHVAPHSSRATRPLSRRGRLGSRQGGGVQRRVQEPLGPQASCPQAQSLPTVSPPRFSPATAGLGQRPLVPHCERTPPGDRSQHADVRGVMSCLTRKSSF